VSHNVVVPGVRWRSAVAVVVASLFLATPALASTPRSGGGGVSGGASSSPSDGGGSSSANTTTTSDSSSSTTGDSKHLGDRTLREGMSGHDVRVLQAYLTVAGFGVTVDGDFGPATLRAVRGFQRAQGMTANGVVTRSVELALRKDVAAMDARPPTGTTRINSDGTATAPASAPATVQQVVAAANRIIDTSYCVGGGHGSFNSSCYDCSGSASYALHGGGLLNSPEDSTGLESFGSPGPGRWITVYADASHAFIVVAGRAFDTADYGGPNIPSGSGPRWRSNPRGNLQDGGNYIVRHPAGL
jgi:peptidoglycan hydrolase-like protein with peptidoglycan-binding domain